MLLRYIFFRVLMLIPVSISISVVIFMIVHLLPGDPIDNLIRVGSSPDDRAALITKYGLDQPLFVQYFRWIGAMFQGDFGEAIVLRRPVADLIAQNLPYSLTLGALAFAFSSIVGIILGTISATTRSAIVEQFVRGFILLGSTVPGFWLALLMILFFAVQLQWFPVSGAKGWECAGAAGADHRIWRRRTGGTGHAGGPAGCAARGFRDACCTPRACRRAPFCSAT